LAPTDFPSLDRWGVPGAGPTTDPGEPIVPAEEASAPRITRAELACGPGGRVVLSVTWEPGLPAGEQRLDLSQFANDFYGGTFATSEPLPADRTELLWPELFPGVTYRLRVRVLRGGTWQAGPVEVLPSQTCPQGDAVGP
jgi:hypothetical protein